MLGMTAILKDKLNVDVYAATIITVVELSGLLAKPLGSELTRNVSTCTTICMATGLSFHKCRVIYLFSFDFPNSYLVINYQTFHI